MTTSKTDVLFNLGEIAGVREWPDYLEYGFEKSDVEQLLWLVADTDLLYADPKTKDAWVPVHAWRILGQLRDERAVLPLIALFEVMFEDDWALSELPRVVGMLGESAIEPLVTLMNTDTQDEFVRIMAVDGLSELVKNYPILRSQVFSHYRKFMQRLDGSEPGINGMLIGYLLDLEGKELIEEIRALYAHDCVEIACAGDLDTVEIEFGLRSEGTVAASDDEALQNGPGLMLDELPSKDSDVIEIIEYYLGQYRNEHSIDNLSGLDGFISALACSPNAVKPSEWLPRMWGGAGFMPEWESLEEFELFNQALFAFHNHIIDGLDAGTHRALIIGGLGSDEKSVELTSWSNGFVKGYELWGESADIAVEMAVTQFLAALVSYDGDPIQTKPVDPNNSESDLRSSSVDVFLDDLYNELKKYRPQPALQVINKGPKVGRNDPCPCGSGKKFKKCCSNAT